jgi:hypothetical protein
MDYPRAFDLISRLGPEGQKGHLRAEFGRCRGIADFGKPSAQQIYGFTA